MTHEKFGENLKEWRVRRGWTQRDLQELSGVPLEAISRMEHGKQQPTWQTAIKLARALRISLDALATEEILPAELAPVGEPDQLSDNSAPLVVAQVEVL